MNWTEAMNKQASAAALDRVSDDALVMRSAPAISWDPYEVWLNRIKRPRDLAANRDAADAKNPVRRLPE